MRLARLESGFGCFIFDSNPSNIHADIWPIWRQKNQPTLPITWPSTADIYKKTPNVGVYIHPLATNTAAKNQLRVEGSPSQRPDLANPRDAAPRALAQVASSCKPRPDADTTGNASIFIANSAISTPTFNPFGCKIPPTRPLAAPFARRMTPTPPQGQAAKPKVLMLRCTTIGAR
jgi:hypothetical protein